VQAALTKAEKARSSKNAAAAKELESLAGQLTGDALAGADGKRAAALAETLKGIAGRLR
jgi:hypothetical protein